jgi:adenylate kinase family enzyme
MDGSYDGTLDLRLRACDTVVFLDMPRWLCLWRIVRRRLQFHRRSRPDVSDGCPERLHWQFLRWIWSYPQLRRPGILERLQRRAADQRAVVLRSSSEVDAFLEHISGSQLAGVAS